VAFTWRCEVALFAGAVTDFATALDFAPDQQAAIGSFCGNTVAMPDRADHVIQRSEPWGVCRILIPADGTENDDKNPRHIAPRHLFDVGVGSDNLFKAIATTSQRRSRR
jgi:hypothetical protein